MKASRAENRFDRGARLTLAALALVFGYMFVDLGYRLSLPTDGWEVSEAVDTGLVYLRNISGSPSPLQAGDHVIAVNGFPAVWETVYESNVLQDVWRVGAVIDYTLVRDGQEMTVPVTLKRWDLAGWAGQQFLHPITLAGLLSNWILFALALVVFLRRPDNLSAGPFLLVTAMFAGSSLSETVPFGFTAWIDPRGVFLGRVSWILLTSLFSFAFIHFAMVFPKPTALQRRLPWIPFAAGAIGFLLVVLFPTQVFSWLWFVFSLLLGVGLLIRNAFTMRDPVSRAQIRWGVGGIMAGLGTFTVMVALNTSGLVLIGDNEFAIISAVGTTLMGVMLGIGISRYRLFDIDIIIRRTLSYAILTALLALVYFGSVAVLQGVVAAAGGEQSPLVIVLSTLAIAALVSPLRRRVQDFIDRRFYRQRYDVEHTLAAFARTARDKTDLDRLSAELLQVVRDTMKPAGISLWMPPGNNGRRPMIDTGSQEVTGRPYRTGAGKISADPRKEIP